MNATNRTLSIPATFGSILLASFLVGTPAEVGAQPLPPPPEVVVAPPPEVIATVEPVYYEGRPAYWYGGHWYWRDTHGWHWYGVEPAYLRDHRAHAPPPRYHYERRR